MRRSMSLYVVARPGFLPGDAVAREHTDVVADRPQAETCEALFWALDGRDLVVRGRRWRVAVFSVVELAGRRYVQLSLEGAQQYLVTLRLAADVTMARLIPPMLTWLAHPTASGEVIDIQ